MNKRIICLLLSLVMLLSVALAGCSKKTDEDIKEDITEEASRNTVTLSMYLLSEDEISGEQEQKMEEAVNKITKSKFKAKIDLRYVTAEEYYDVLEAAFEESQTAKANFSFSASKTTSDPKSTTAEETVVNEYGVTELKYPDITDYQVDIFYLGGLKDGDGNYIVSGLEKFDEYMGNNWIADIGDIVTGDARKLTDYILPEYFDNFEFSEDGIYAVPNNLPVGDYTYLLIDKSIMSNYNYSVTDEFETLASENVQDILSKVDRFHSDEFVPLYSSEGELDLTNVQYIGVDEGGRFCHDFSVLGGAYSQDFEFKGTNHNYQFNNLFSEAVVDQMRTIISYKEKGYYADDAERKAIEEEGKQNFAVGYIKCGLQEIEKYRDKYDVIVLERPRISMADVYDNLFAVGAYSSDTARSMEVITYLNTNAEFRNLMLYGIEEDNYKIVETTINDVVYKSAERLNDDYMMSAERTGNVMISYPLVGELPNIRDYQRLQNLDAATELDFGFKLEYGPNFVNVEAMKEVRALSMQIYDELIAIETVEDFDRYIKGYEDPENEENNIIDVKKRIAANEYYALMYAIDYSSGAEDYLSKTEIYGEGCSLRYLYCTWLTDKAIYVPFADETSA